MIFVVRVHTYMRSGTSVNRIANANKRNVSRVMQRFANFFVKVSCVTNRYRPLRLLFPRLSVLTKKRNPRNKATRFYHFIICSHVYSRLRIGALNKLRWSGQSRTPKFACVTLSTVSSETQ